MKSSKCKVYQTQADVNHFIDLTHRVESICDDTLEVLYHKYDKVPSHKIILAEIDFLSGKELRLVDELFLANLKTTFTHVFMIGMKEYLSLWTLERHIPYKSKLNDELYNF